MEVQKFKDLWKRQASVSLKIQKLKDSGGVYKYLCAEENRDLWTKGILTLADVKGLSPNWDCDTESVLFRESIVGTRISISTLKLIHLAAMHPNVAVIKAIARNHHPFYEIKEEKHEMTALNFAAQACNMPVVEFLLKEAKVKTRSGIDNNKPVILAAMNGCLSAVKMLREHDYGSDVVYRNEESVCTAIEECQVETVKYFLNDTGYLRDIKCPYNRWGSRSRSGDSLLNYAVKQKCSHAVKFLCEDAGFDPNKITFIYKKIDNINEPVYPLLLATHRQDIKAVKALKSCGAKLYHKELESDPQIVDTNPVKYAATYGSLELLEALLPVAAANMRQGGGINTLSHLEKDQDEALASKTAILDTFACGFSYTYKGYQASQAFAENEDLRKAKLVLAAGADVNAKDASGNTVLHHAAYNLQSEWVKYLVNELGADITITNNAGKTPRDLVLKEYNRKNSTWTWELGYHQPAPREKAILDLLDSVSKKEQQKNAPRAAEESESKEWEEWEEEEW